MPPKSEMIVCKKPDEAPELLIAHDTKLRDIAEKISVSMSELRRLVEQRAIDNNDKVLTSIEDTLELGVLKVGKHRFYKLNK